MASSRKKPQGKTRPPQLPSYGRKKIQTILTSSRELHNSLISCLYMELLLITGSDCHLCERARDVLSALGHDAREIDVTSPEALSLADSGVPLMFLPVLLDGEHVLAYGRFSERALRKQISQVEVAR
jgi:hypothetical protein